MDHAELERAALGRHAWRTPAPTHPDECCGAVRRPRRPGRGAPLHQRPETAAPGRPRAPIPRDALTAYTPEPRELFAVLRAGERARGTG